MTTTVDGKPISELLAEKRERERRKDEQLVMTVPEAGAKLGLSREASYDAARNGDIPTIRINRLIKVPKLRFEQLLSGEWTPPPRKRESV